MTLSGDVYYDPYDFEIDTDPYPVWKRMRDEAPLYYNEKYDFYALSRFEDVERCSVDWRTYISGKGSVLEMIKSGMEMPPGMILFEDPPAHDLHRGLLSRVFTPRKMNAIEPKVREFCARSLDPLVGSGGFDFIGDLGAQMPMRTIGMLLGIPEDDQEAIRNRIDAGMHLSEGAMPDREASYSVTSSDDFEEYIEWRSQHPSDDLMTELLNAEFEDESGATRKLDLRWVPTSAFWPRPETRRPPGSSVGPERSWPSTRISASSWRRTRHSFRARLRSCCVTRPPHRCKPAT